MAPAKLLPKSDKLYGVRSVTTTVIHIVQDGVTTSVNIDLVTKVPTGLRAIRSSATASGEGTPGATITNAATAVRSTAQSPRETSSVCEDEEICH